MEKQLIYGISTYKVNELAETLGITKSSVSEKLKEVEEGIEKSKDTNRITGILPEAVQDYFLSRGYWNLFTRTVIISVQSCSGGIGKSSLAQGLFSQARRMKSRKKSVIKGKEISPAIIFCDSDSQYSSSVTLLGKPQDDDKPVLKHYLSNEAELDEIIVPQGDETYLITSNLQNLYLDKVINSVQSVKNLGMKLIKDLDKKFGQCYVFIADNPPALSSFNQSLIVAMAQTNKEKYNACLLSPIRALDKYGIKASEITITEAKEIIRAFNLPEPNIYTFLTMYNRVGKTSVEILKQVLENPIIKNTLLDNVVRYSSEFSKANLQSKSIFSGKQTPATEDIALLYLTLLGYEKIETGNV